MIFSGEATSVNANKLSSASNTSLYETVDYFDIFGDDTGPAESFNPTVIELSTQQNPGKSNTDFGTDRLENRQFKDVKKNFSFFSFIFFLFLPFLLLVFSERTSGVFPVIFSFDRSCLRYSVSTPNPPDMRSSNIFFF